MSPARGRTALTVRLLGLGSLAMTLSNETLPFVLEGVQISPATWPGMVGLLAEIELTRPVGQRITKLTLDGVPVAGDQQFVVAVNNYRRSGGGNFPHIATAAVVHQQQQEIRQLLIDWAQQHQTIDADAFFEPNWQLTVDGRPAV